MAMRSISLLMFITKGKDKNKMKYFGAKVEHMCRFGDFLAGLGLKIGDSVKEKVGYNIYFVYICKRFNCAITGNYKPKSTINEKVIYFNDCSSCHSSMQQE